MKLKCVIEFEIDGAKHAESMGCVKDSDRAVFLFSKMFSKDQSPQITGIRWEN